jgi:2,3-bisphosphoglycerate-independent phosphoglycerate mutase
MKYVVFLGDGMADEPLPELSNRTPLMVAFTPYLDRLARNGRCGTLLTLPEGFPTSSDVANLSVLGYDLASCYTGRGPLEALSQAIELGSHDIAFRCNLITARDGVLDEYSGGHLSNEEASELIQTLNEKFGSTKIRFYPGVSYRNILVLSGEEFSDQVEYHKPDSSHGMAIRSILLAPKNAMAQPTADLLNQMILDSEGLLNSHPVNERRVSEGKKPANMIWPWSPGKKPELEPFQRKYGRRGAIISAVDVIFGIGIAAGMEIIKVPGATGYVDTNYEGKADAALRALDHVDFIYVHVEAIDEVSHLGQLDLKLQAIKDFDRRVVGHFLDRCPPGVTIAVLPDHPVPLKLRKHTRTPVPFAIYKPGATPDMVSEFNEYSCREGSLGELRGDGFMKVLLRTS